MKLALVSLVALSSFGMLLPGGDLDTIALYIQTGKAKELAQHFDASVEIAILEKEETYSKAQAEMVLRDFFAKNRPASFKLIHNGSTSQYGVYGIGTLITDKGAYRTTIYMKKKGENLFIQEIRFEKE